MWREANVALCGDKYTEVHCAAIGFCILNWTGLCTSGHPGIVLLPHGTVLLVCLAALMHFLLRSDVARALLHMPIEAVLSMCGCMLMEQARSYEDILGVSTFWPDAPLSYAVWLQKSSIGFNHPSASNNPTQSA